MYVCEEQKWDLEREVRKRDWEVQQPSDILFFCLITLPFCTDTNPAKNVIDLELEDVYFCLDHIAKYTTW